MRVLICGVGGIGSWLTEMISQAYEQDQIDLSVTVEIADDDCVEPKNVRYQNFVKEDVGTDKALALFKRIPYLAKAKCMRIRKKHLKGYDLIISCVDNFQTTLKTHT